MAAPIEITGLRKKFGKTAALDGLDLSVADGEVHGFLGPNGAGKTTTIRILLGLLRADGGSARLLGGLARTGDPITHDLLDELPQTQALRYVRDMLVSSGVLPARNEHLERLAPWLEHLLHDKPTHHARLIRPFAHWFVLRRARRAATRRTFTRGSADFARPWTSSSASGSIAMASTPMPGATPHASRWLLSFLLDRYQRQHRRALVPVGKARLGRLYRPAHGRRPRRHWQQPETY